MSADPARPGPPGASPSASSVGASPAGSKPASTSLSAPAAAALSAAALKPASKPRSSIFERVRVAALRNGLAPTSSSGGLAAMAAAAMTPTSALGSPALADRAPRPAGSPSLEPGLGGVSTARMTAPTSSKPSKPSDEADEAAIEHALFSSPEKVARSLPPPSPPKLTMAHPSSSQASAAEPVPSGRSADTPQTVPTFKKRVNASGAVTPTVARSPVPTVVGARRPSLELGDKPGSIVSAGDRVPHSARSPGTTGASPAVRPIAGSTAGPSSQPAKMKQTFRRINRDAPLGPPSTISGLATSTVATASPSAARPPPVSVRPIIAAETAAGAPSPASAGSTSASPALARLAVSSPPRPQTPASAASPRSSPGTITAPAPFKQAPTTTSTHTPGDAGRHLPDEPSVVKKPALAATSPPPVVSSDSQRAQLAPTLSPAPTTIEVKESLAAKAAPAASPVPSVSASATAAVPSVAPAVAQPISPAATQQQAQLFNPPSSSTSSGPRPPSPQPSPEHALQGLSQASDISPSATSGPRRDPQQASPIVKDPTRDAQEGKPLAPVPSPSAGHAAPSPAVGRADLPSASAKPPSSSSAGPIKKRARAVLSDSDSESSTPVALPASKKQATSADASRIAPSRATPTVALQTPSLRSYHVSSDEDDVPLGSIIYKNASPSTSPKPRSAPPPSSEPNVAVAAQPPSKAALPSSVAEPAVAVKQPAAEPTPALSSAPAPQPPVSAPVKEDPFFVGSDMASDDDDDIIFVAERPPGHQLIIPPKAAVPSTKPSAPVPEPESSEQADENEPTTQPESSAQANSRPSPRRVTRHESPPSSDPLNIQNGEALTRSVSPVVEKTPHSVLISPRKRRVTRASTSEVDEPAPSKRPRRAAAAKGRASAAVDDESDSEPDAEGGNLDDPREKDVEEVEEDDVILRLHRSWCEKCEQPPADELLAALEKKRKRGGRKKKAASLDEDVISDGEAIEQMGGWIECQRCCVASHFGCLSADQRSNLLKQVSLKTGEKQYTVEIGETSSFVCGGCAKNPTCFSCGSADMQEQLGKKAVASAERVAEAATAPEQTAPTAPADDAHAMEVDAPSLPVVAPSGAAQAPLDVDAPPAETKADGSDEDDDKQPILFFRCFRCKRGIHYSHLLKPRDLDKATPIEIAAHHQDADWQCHDCLRWVFDVDKVIAWRPSPATAVEDPLPPGTAADYRKQLPREYLVKWTQLGFRHIEWVPHQWLLANSKQRLRNFLHSGSDLAPFLSQLSAEAADEPAEEGAVAQLLALGGGPEAESAAALDPTGTAIFTAVGPPAANPNADAQIPTAWKTIDRVLTVWLKRPSKRSLAKKGRGGRRVYDRDIDDEDVLELEPGLRPENEEMVDIDEWQEITALALDERAIKQVIWAYVKWQDLPYKLATYDTPPPTSDVAAYAAFERAWRSYTKGLQTIVPILTNAEIAAREAKKKFTNIRSQPACVVGGTLMDFQLQGLNWLYSQWCKGTPCILADDMGLGKTVQIAALVGFLATKHYYPTLIVVPNSTISNWMREFEKWIPDVRVAPYNGEKDSRAIIENYELFHGDGDGAGGRNRGLKVHCVITTYEAVTHKSFNEVFRRVPRWEMLVADEGQRLKNDASKIVKSLGTLNIAHRVLLTGTPLNNNLRELFNLMNFLDPANWSNLDQLTAEYESVNSDNLAALRERLKPYFLRRVKADVLKLPPKHEVIVPIAMRSLQREVYKGLMMSNAELIKNLVGGIQQGNPRQLAKTMKATNLSNLMMQLRKACAHPYLNQEDIEDKTVGPEEMHKRLTEASAKLSFLKLLLPKLFQKGHRILLFSGFVIALDILSDWLDGEGIPFFRLDGNTPQDQRQKDIDAFNAPGALTNLFILSTRAGGVGINLATADTVVMFDADFNPHQDIQAIARAYRFGQTKKVMVFKLMIRNSVEEKILEKGKRKMVLDQLIIQDMAKEEDTDVGSLIAFGAKALFAEEEAAVKHNTSEDVDGIIQRAETAEDVSEADGGGGGGGMKFDYAEIYDGSKDAAAEGEASAAADADEDFWDSIVKRATKEKEEREEAGRGARRAKKTIYVEQLDSPPPEGGKPSRQGSRQGSPGFDSDAANGSSSDDSDFEVPRSLRRRSLSLDDLASANKDGPGPLAKVKQPKLPKIHKAARDAVSVSAPIPGQAKFVKLEQALLKIATQVQVDLASLLRTIHATTTAPVKRRELWDIALNLIASHLEVFGIASSTQLQPLIRRKKFAYSFLDALPYNGRSQAPAPAPLASSSHNDASSVAGPLNPSGQQ